MSARKSLVLRGIAALAGAVLAGQGAMAAINSLPAAPAPASAPADLILAKHGGHHGGGHRGGGHHGGRHHNKHYGHGNRHRGGHNHGRNSHNVIVNNNYDDHHHHHHHDDGVGDALIGGIVGIGIGAAIANSANDSEDRCTPSRPCPHPY